MAQYVLYKIPRSVNLKSLCLIFCYIILHPLFLPGQEQKKIFSTLPDTTTIIALNRHAHRIRKQLPDSALVLLNKALTLSRQTGYREGIVQSLNNLASCLLDEKQQGKASLVFYREALAAMLPIKKQRPGLLAEIYNGLGANYTFNAQYDSALHYYSLALSAFREFSLEDAFLERMIYGNISTILVSTGQHDRALHYLKEVIRLSQQAGDSSRLATSYLNTGTAYSLKDEMDSAMGYWRMSLALYRHQPNKGRLQDVYIVIGTSWFLQKDLPKARSYLDTAIATDPERALQLPALQQSQAAVLFESGQYAAAIPYSLRAVSLSSRSGMRQQRLYAYWVLAGSYAQTGNMAKAYRYQKAHSRLMDSIYNEETVRKIAEWDARSRLSEKDKELAQQKLLLLSKETRLRQKNIWIGVTVGSGLLLFLFFYLQLRNYRRLRKTELETMKQEQEVDRLQAAMHSEEQERQRIARELHDGMGVLLSSVGMNYSLIGKDDYLKPAGKPVHLEGMALIEELKSELRTIAHNLMPEAMAGGDLLNAVKKLAEKIDKANSIHIDLQVFGIAVPLAPERSFYVYRMIEELLNNIIKHADASSAWLQLIFHEDRLSIVLEDNGKGIRGGRPGSGMGRINLEQRAEKLNAHLLITSDAGEGTSVELEIPYRGNV